MSVLRSKLLVVLCLTFWFGATQHCGLEGVGLFAHGSETAGACCAGTPEACATDACSTVEDGRYNPARTDLKSAAPHLAVVWCLVGLDPISPSAETDGKLQRPDFERALDWSHTWQFVQRAALSPRAPSYRRA